MLTRQQRIDAIHSVKPFRVIDNDPGVLLRQLIEIAKGVDYYTPAGEKDGFWDELLPLFKRWTEEGIVPEKNGEVEPSQTLLLVFIEHLIEVTQLFNNRWNNLGEWYWREIVGVGSPEICPGKIWFTFQKSISSPILLSKGTSFYQEDEEGLRSYYKLAEDLSVENIEITHISTLFYERNKEMLPAGYLGYITALHFQDLLKGSYSGQMMFGEEKIAKEQGLIITHPSLLLREGKRKVTLLFYPESDAWQEELCRIEAVLERYQLKWSREKLFFELVNSMFYLAISTEEGWTVIDDYTVSIEEEFLKLQFTMGMDFPSSVVCIQEVHGMESLYPSLKVYPDLDAWLYPYSWLSLFRMQKIVIQCDVRHVRDLQLYNELGTINNSAPFQPFGINRSKGAWFILGNYEMATKHTTDIDVSLQWSDLPTDENGLQGYYKGYNKDITNRSFHLRSFYLSDYNWYPTGKRDEFYLFSSVRSRPDGTPLPAAPLSSYSNLSGVEIEHMPVVKEANANYSYSINSRNGFIRFVLQDPDMGFGEKEYYYLFSAQLIENSRRKKKIELLQPPLLPVIERMSINYRSEDVIDFRKRDRSNHTFVYLSYPLGIVPASSFLYILDTDASLLIALKGVQGGELLTMFFDFLPTGKDCSHSSLPHIQWYWGDGYVWWEVFPESVLEDGTYNFMTSGLIKIRLPENIPAEQYDRQGNFWLRAGVGENADVIPRLKNIYLNAVQLIRDPDRDKSGGKVIVPEELVPEKKLPGIETYSPLTPFYGEFPEEDSTGLQIRLAEYINHRGRAVLPTDYEQITLHLFPEIAAVKCIPGFNGKEFCDGIIGLIIIPLLTETYTPCEPVASSYMLLKVREGLSGCLSPYVKDLVVMNPEYVVILIRCEITFCADISLSPAKAALQQIMDDWIAPWQSRNQIPDIDYDLSVSTFIRSINREKYVREITAFTIVRIVKGEEEYTLYEYTKGGDDRIPRSLQMIYIPAKQHIIRERIEPEFGISEMEIEDNMVII